MYPPPPESVVQKLHGTAVDVVSHGKYIIHLGFDNGIRLSFGAPFRFGNAESIEASPVFEFPLTESSLVRLAGESVINAHCESDWTLEMRFSNNDVLIIFGDVGPYEAYSLFVDGEEYFV